MRYDAKMHLRASVLLLLAAVCGCSSPDTRSYTVSVRNQTVRPMTIALTKTGGLVEDAWASPEQIADRQSSEIAEHGFALIAPGRIATVKNIKGIFPSNAQAVLRVYGGDPSLGEMLQMIPGHNRADFALKPGQNDLVIRDSAKGFIIEPRRTGF